MAGGAPGGAPDGGPRDAEAHASACDALAAAATLVAVPDATTFVALDNPAAVAHAVSDITAASTSP